MKLASLPSKWVENLAPDTPAAEVAARVLGTRLGVVPILLEAAAAGDGGDAEAVHQVRVWSRRSDAALRVFRSQCPQTKYRQLRRWMRRVRRAAAAARLCDVQLAMLEQPIAEPSPELERGVKIMRQHLNKRRRKAVRKVVKLCAANVPDHLRAMSEELLAGVRALGGDAGSSAVGPTLRELAGRVLPGLVERFRQAGEKDQADLEDLHMLRLAGKRLRYALEVLAPCFAPTFRKHVYQRLSELQERLGQINDAYELAERAARLRKQTGGRKRRAALRALETYWRQRCESLRRDLTHWWRSRESVVLLDGLGDLAARVGVSADGRAAWGSTRGAGLFAARRRSDLDRVARAPQRLRVAAIDVGTNSIRLVVAESDPRSTFRVIEDVKETTRLGSGLYFSGQLKLDAVRASIRALQRMKAIAQGHHVARIRVAATAAVRDAANGAAFVELVKRRCGLTLETIDSEQEARLAHSSVAHAFDLSHERVAVVDIGGGSTEVVFSAYGFVDAIAKLPLGAVHLTEAYSSPAGDGRYRFEAMQRAIEQALAAGLPAGGVDAGLIIGTGGTFTTLAKMSLRRGLIGRDDGRLPFNLRGYGLDYTEVKLLLDWLGNMSLTERRSVPGISSRRAEIIVAGVAILERLMNRLRVRRVCVHDGGIRDGLLTQMLDELGYEPDSVRAREEDALQQLRDFARRCKYEQDHCEHVTTLALQIFDQLVAQMGERPAPWARPENRELLHAAALLHDIGHVIGYRGHHKHAYDLIMRSRIAIFSPRELEIIANVARYHCRDGPSRRHACFARLADDDQRLVAHLAGILRIADGLDRTHTQNVQAVHVVLVPRRRVRFVLRAEREPAINLRFARRKADVFEKSSGLRSEFVWRRCGASASESENNK